MYWSSQEVDNSIYPPCCPGCYALKWLDFDWETGLGYCRLCGWDPDNNLLSSGEEGGA